jgi:hypothetical protein
MRTQERAMPRFALLFAAALSAAGVILSLGRRLLEQDEGGHEELSR